MQPNNQPNPFQTQPNINGDQPYDYSSGRRPVPPKNPSRISEHLSTILILISAPLLAILITVFVFRTYQVDGPSMETTLHDNDRLIINKLPKTFSKIAGSHYIPERDDIIVFSQRSSFDQSGNSKKQLIKRVIGLPGDQVVIKDGVVTIYNDENPDGLLVDRDGPQAAVIKQTSGNIDETVNEGEVFVLGDNRGNSSDSRAFGTISSDDIVGKLTFRIFPFDKWENF